MTESSASPTAAATTTARGDRDGRRRDVLTAAAEIIEESGWAGFSIRSIAARTGVSTGAVYQWFSGKDEIFGELYDREIRAGLDVINAFPEGIGLDQTVQMMVEWVVELHEKLGRYKLEFVTDGGGRVVPEPTPLMETTVLDLATRAGTLLDKAAAIDGVTIIESSSDRITWLWAGCIGAAEQLIVDPARFPGDRRAEFLAFSAQRLAKSLLV